MIISRIRILAVLLICLTASVGCNRSNDAEVAKVKAEAEAAKAKAEAEVAKVKADAEVAKAKAELDAAKAAQAQPKVEDANRKVAEWVLSVSGAVKVEAENKVIEIVGSNGSLPSGPFGIVEIRVTGDKITDDNIGNLSDVKSLKSLLSLWVTASKVTDFSFLKGMKDLRYFDGNDTDLDDACVGYLKDCPRMETMLIGTNFQNHITDDGIQNLKDMKFLTTLNICGTRATDVGLGHIKGLTNLTWLAMGNQGVKTDISDAGLANLADMKKLETLIIVNAAISDAGLDYIKKLTNLKRVHLGKTQVTEAGAESLKQALPDCKVEFSPQ